MTDVTIMGAGIFGLACAYGMARRGARVRVIDPAGVGAGASGGVVGALSPHAPEGWNAKKEFQLESLVMASDWWADAARAGGTDPLYARTGRIVPLADAREVALAEARADRVRDLWRGEADWQVVPIAGNVWGAASATGLAVRDSLSARIAPRAALRTLADAVVASGGEIVERAAPRGPVVWATGADGLSELSGALGAGIGDGVKGQAALLALDLAQAPQLFAGGVHIVPHADGTVAVGSTSEITFSAGMDTDFRLDALVEGARAVAPVLAGAAVVRRWAGVRPRAVTRAPILGAWPGRAGHYIANGGFKIGFGIAPKVAEVMADLVLDGRDRIPAGFGVADAIRKARPVSGGQPRP